MHKFKPRPPPVKGSLRVGEFYKEKGIRRVPKYPGHTPIVVHTEKYNKYSTLSPYVLKNAKDEIMENIWHAHKVWEKVPAVNIPKSQWDRRIIWNHPAETHIGPEGKPNDKYHAWRKKLLANPFAVRYPAGRANAKNARYSMKNWKILSYIEARKEIYLPEYANLAKEQAEFKNLRKRLEQGENLIIVEVDGPRQDSLSYYKEKYGVGDDWIKDHSIEATRENLEIMLNDDKHSFGHGYCLAAALLDLDQDIIE